MSSNLDGLWADDLLERRKDAEYIIRFLDARVKERIADGKTGSYVLNLDAGWGRGKTFFLTRLGKYLEVSGFEAVYINAWESDYAGDPLVPIIEALDSRFSKVAAVESAAKKIWEAAKVSGLKVAVAGGKAAGRQLLSKYLGPLIEILASDSEDLLKKAAAGAFEAAKDELTDEVAGELIEHFEKTKSSIEQFKRGLNQVIEEGTRKPLFILIDELDRCRPDYAINLLERVKHLFAINNVVFVFATNSEQLIHSVGKVYGEGFDSRRYLLRFFDRTYRFADPTCHVFVADLFNTAKFADDVFSTPSIDPVKLFEGFREAFGIGLRDAEQCFDILRTIVTTWDQPQLAIELVALVPMIMAHQQGDPELWNVLLGGRLKDLRGKLKNADVEPIEFKTGTESPFVHKSETVPLVQIASDFIAIARTDFANLIAHEPEDGHKAWILCRLKEEAKLLHPGGPPANTYSAITRYPLLITQAGRFVTS